MPGLPELICVPDTSSTRMLALATARTAPPPELEAFSVSLARRAPAQGIFRTWPTWSVFDVRPFRVLMELTLTLNLIPMSYSVSPDFTV